ncbi:MAG: hypothetical protein IKH77_09960 [Clostridia bacterium]|nr:hypothetical protein [Clostridia bacterium]
MQLYVLVLNHTEYLEPLFKAMLDRGIRGATVLDSTGMMRVLADDENVDLPMLGLLRHMYSPERRASKTVFVVLHDEQLPVMAEVVEQVTGGLDQPDSGIAFALPLQYVKGLGQEA